MLPYPSPKLSLPLKPPNSLEKSSLMSYVMLRKLCQVPVTSGAVVSADSST